MINGNVCYIVQFVWFKKVHIETYNLPFDFSGFNGAIDFFFWKIMIVLVQVLLQLWINKDKVYLFFKFLITVIEKRIAYWIIWEFSGLHLNGRYSTDWKKHIKTILIKLVDQALYFAVNQYKRFQYTFFCSSYWKIPLL